MLRKLLFKNCKCIFETWKYMKAWGSRTSGTKIYLKNVSQFSRKMYNQKYKYSMAVMVLSLSHVQHLQVFSDTIAKRK